MPHTVRVGCICPDPTTHPDGDDVVLPSTLGFTALATCIARLRMYRSANPDSDIAMAMAQLQEIYVVTCPTGWTVTDKGKPVPCTPATLRERLVEAHPSDAFTVADRADDLYAGVVLAPLVQEALTSSRVIQMAASTLATTARGRKTRTRSKPSSTTTTPTAATAATG